MPSVLEGFGVKLPPSGAGKPGDFATASPTDYSPLAGTQPGSVMRDSVLSDVGAPAPPPSPQHRDFTDVISARKNVYDRVLESVNKIGPLQNVRHTLELGNVRYVDPEDINLQKQKQAILTGKSLHRRLRGTWKLSENATGKTLDEREMTIAQVPFMTPRGTFILNGTEYTLSNQMRLRPGVFTRIKENGEIESHVNVMPGNGISHRYFLDPESGVFKINIGQAKLPLYPILKAIGVSDKELRKTWGNDLLSANMQAPDAKAVAKLYQRLVRRGDPLATEEQKGKTLAEMFHSMRLDPEVTKRTLGAPHEHLTKDAILDTTKKLIRVSKQEEGPDDRDHLAFQTLHGPEDLLSERITKDRSFLRNMLFKLSFKGNLSQLQPGALTRQLHATLLHTGLGQCFSADTYVLTRRGFILWPDVIEDDEFACRIADKLVYAKAYKLHKYTYDGFLLGCRTKRLSYLVTPNHRLWCRSVRGDYRAELSADAHGKQRIFDTALPVFDSTADADFVLPAVINAHWGHSTGELILPGDVWAEFLGWYMAEGWISNEKATVTGGAVLRVNISQCPIMNPVKHAAIVRVLSALPFNWHFNAKNKTFVIHSKQLATELSTYGRGSANKRMPRYCFDWSNRRLRLLANTYIAGDGNVYDGHVKIETTSHGLACDMVELFGRLGGTGRIMRRQLNIKNPNWSDSYVVTFGSKITALASANIDTVRSGKPCAYFEEAYNGVVYCATVPGEMLYVMREGRTHWSLNSAEEINPAELLDAQSRVTRLGEGGIGSIDAVPDEARSVQPSHTGFIDLIRTPECHSADSEVMVRTGWKVWPDVTSEDEFACLVDGQLEWHNPTHLTADEYAGQMYGAKTTTLEYLVTPNHRMHVRPCDDQPSAWRIEAAEYTHGRSRKFMCGGFLPVHGEYVKTFSLPEITAGSNSQKRFTPFLMDDWAEFMGWFLSEGHFTYDEKTPHYTTGISQSRKANPENCDRIAELLTRMNLSWNYNESMKCFMLSGKQLTSYCKQFGYCHDKFIPEEYLTLHVSARQRLMDALLLGDGRKNKKGVRDQLCTTSKKLAEDFQRLAFSLGYSTQIAIEPESRKETYHDNYVVHIHARNERTLIRRKYFIEHYVGRVYCASVPGGLLFVRRGKGFGHWSGNSFKVGVDTRLTYTARKGSDGRIYAPITNIKTGKTEYKSPQDLADIPLAFPNEFSKNSPYVATLFKGNADFLPREQVKYALPHMENAFSPLANMIPGKSAIKGQRMSMGSRYLAQALSLSQRESPFVQGAMPGRHMDRSFEDEYGKHLGALHTPLAGTVKKVTADEIVLRHDDGTEKGYELYNHFPYSRKTFIHNEPNVRPGQRVEQGQLLAKSNFTDKDGTAALGLNARVAFIPYRGANYEDAAVISESFQKRLTSEHMYQHDQEWDDKIKKGLRPFVGLFPVEYTKEQLKSMDDQGVVKAGTVIKHGDPLVLVAEERERTHSQIHRGRKPTYANKTLTWEHHSPGIVTDVAHTNKGVAVAVKAYVPMQVGDKLSNRYGGKGVVAEILPDDRMPHDEDGTPYEIALNPLGMISRINPAQIVEAALGKIAAKTGKPYKIEDFNTIEDLADFARQEMKAHGMPPTDTIIDPHTGRKIPNVLTGYQYLLKLHHTSEAKGQGRGIGGYTADEVPAKGGAAGSKRIALLETNALLSHGATEFLRDAHLVRGQQNDAYWQAFMSGHRPPEPEVPKVYRKFIDSLKASGINAVREGRQMHIMAMTDKDVNTLAGDRDLENVDTVDWKEGLKPKRGGLFDQALTGGHSGNRWSAIRLHEPLPNPAFEEPIRRLLGLTQKKFEGVISGVDTVGDFGSGPIAIKRALEHIDLDKEIDRARTEIKGGKRTTRDEANRKLMYLKNAKRLDIHPKDWVLSRVPVLPPVYRHVSVMAGSGNPLVSDANYLYKELFDSNQLLKESQEVGTGDYTNERLNVYNAFKGVVGLGDPIQPKNQERQVKGILKQVFGPSPKLGMVQRQLLGATVELVGRAVITPNPDLDMDQVGLPENKAWEVYKPFIIRRLVQKGVPRLEAARAFKDQLPIARNAMADEMKERPVVISRAPVLHRYGIMGFWPKLVKGDVMQIPPLTTKGFNADFDGDTMNYHVPATDEARQEVIDKLLPSKNLLSASDFKVHFTPSQEYQGGLYHATTERNEKQRPHVFRNKQDAMRAYREGRISMNSPVEILEH